MDPLSIAAGCVGLISTIDTLSRSIYGFVRTCREARKDLDKVSWELQSLQSVLRLIEDDATDEQKPFPPVIGQHVLSIVSNCNSVILEIEACIAQYAQKRLRAKVTWAISGQGDVEKLRTNLEAHKSSLELALEMHNLTITKDIKADTTEIHKDTTTIRENTEQILQEILRLQAQLPKDVTTPNDYVLQRFLEEMTTYTEMALDTTVVGNDDDSIRAVYDMEELSEASMERKRSVGSLATSNKPQLLNISETEEASGALVKASPGGDSTTSPKPQVQSQPILRESVRTVFLQSYHEFRLQLNRTGSPARIPSKDEATAQKLVPYVKKEVSTSERLDTRTSEGNAWRGWVNEPMESPIPTNHDGDLGTSDEPQLPSLATPDGVLPEALALRTSPGDDLVAPEQPRRQISPNRRLDNLAESSSPKPSKYETLAPDFNLDSKVLVSQSSDADATEDKKLKKHEFILSEPMIPHVKLLDGNLVVDCDYLSPLGGSRLTWRFTPVTCPPRQFKAENYLLQPLLFSQPNPISTIFSFRLRPGESPAKFAERWSIIHTVMVPVWAWFRSRSIIVHVHGPTGWRGLDDDIATALQEMSISREPKPTIVSPDGYYISLPCDERDPRALGKPVYCVMREAYTTIYPTFSSCKLQLKAGPEAVPIISTAPMTSNDTYRDWVTAIGQQLESELVIDMTEFSEDPGSFSNYLQWVHELGDYLPHEEDTWGIGLKFVRFDDVIGYFREKGYRKQK
ncbi:hypothetical protein LCI18_012986 [Fusarium solani-melongenae]|uniref:Uncharacterized protein n=1 Tax=Fusarium solani subsp. cucurbitae TaxID=2747967 RepID=A0ACD3ZMH7_FUSSC|nr:hypothetical protein LCI18_012986 [Fusarium solani-melongenae]